MAVLGATPMPSGITTPQDLAVALRYGPQTEQALRRSSYLTDALRQLNAEGSQNIHSGGELAAKLLAAAILNRGVGKGQDAVMSALRADQGAETATALTGLKPPPTGEPTVPTGAVPQIAPQPTPQPEPQVPPPQVAPQPQPTNYTPQDRDALIRMGAVEAGGEGPNGIAAAMHVALNRFRAGYGGARSLSEVIHQPHQFTGIQNGVQPDPQALALASQVADGVLGGQTPDQTGGAMAFLNPGLTQHLYGHIPAWAQGGDGHQIGNHVFFGGKPQLAQNNAQPPGPPPTPDANGPAVQTIDQPTPVADQAFAAQALPPSAPGGSSPAAGTAPAGVSPQAPPAGALSANWPKWRPSQDEIGYVESLLNNPQKHAEGVALADRYRQKMLEPEEAQITLINGVPFYIPKDPTSAAHTQPIPVPREALSHIATGEQLGVAAAPGSTFNTDPLGNAKPLTQPANGQMVTSAPGQPYHEHYTPGGVNDPTVPQKPQQGYQYSPSGQAPIKGGPADPTAPMNLAEGTQRIQQNVRPTLDLAIVAKQSAGAVQEGYKQQNGTGDIAMVNGLQHLIDKGVVRGEDVNMQMKSNGIAGGLGQISQYINSNGLLTPDVRQKVLRAAQALYGNIDQQYRAQVMAHRATVDAIYGDGAFDKYVVPLEQQRALGWADSHGGPTPPPPPTPQQQPHLTPGTHDAALAEARRRGLIR